MLESATLRSDVFDLEHGAEPENPAAERSGTSSWNGLGSSGGTRSAGRLRRSGFGFRSSTATQWQKLKSDFISEMRYVSKLRHPCVTTVMGKSCCDLGQLA